MSQRNGILIEIEEYYLQVLQEDHQKKCGGFVSNADIVGAHLFLHEQVGVDVLLAPTQGEQEHIGIA